MVQLKGMSWPPYFVEMENGNHQISRHVLVAVKTRLGYFWGGAAPPLSLFSCGRSGQIERKRGSESRKNVAGSFDGSFTWRKKCLCLGVLVL